MAVDVSQLRRGMARWSRQVFAEATKDRLVACEAAAPVDTGETANSGRLRQSGMGENRLAALVEFPTPQALFTDEGTRAHRITPKKAGGVLVFHWPKLGRVVFFKHVNHPGIEATHWFTDQITEREWRKDLERAARHVSL